jgi:hypothetical protein
MKDSLFYIVRLVRGRHLVDLHVLEDAKANLVDVKRLRAVNIGHRNGDQFQTQIHWLGSWPRKPAMRLGQRWWAARGPEHARDQVRVECEIAPRRLTIVERPPASARGLRVRVDQLPNRPLLLHHRHQVMDAVLA